MYAIIRTGGKQYNVSVGDEIVVEKLNAEVGDVVSFDVLMLVDDNGVKIGTPVVKGASANAKLSSMARVKK